MNTFDAGGYRYPAKLYRIPPGTDFGPSHFNEETFECDLWVKITPNSASEQNAGDQMQSTNRYELRTPWTPTEITDSHVIRTAKHTFAIGGVINVDEANAEWLIMATKVGKGEGDGQST